MCDFYEWTRRTMRSEHTSQQFQRVHIFYGVAVYFTRIFTIGISDSLLHYKVIAKKNLFYYFNNIVRIRLRYYTFNEQYI